MGLIESGSKEVSGGIMAALLDWLATWFDSLSPAHVAAKAAADQETADLKAAKFAAESQYAALLTKYNDEARERAHQLNLQTIAEKQAELDATAVTEVRTNETAQDAAIDAASATDAFDNLRSGR